MTTVDGVTVKVGDWVCFKSDIEQTGQIQQIQPEGKLVLTNPSGFHGDYIGGATKTIQAARDCWLEG